MRIDFVAREEVEKKNPRLGLLNEQAIHSWFLRTFCFAAISTYNS